MRTIDADEAKKIACEYLTDPYHVISCCAVIDKTPTLTPPNEPLTRAERHQYTRQELEQLTTETAIYIEGAGIAQLQWGGLEIAEGCRDGYLYCKHIKPFAMELYNRYWTAFDGPPEEEENQK